MKPAAPMPGRPPHTLAATRKAVDLPVLAAPRRLKAAAVFTDDCEASERQNRQEAAKINREFPVHSRPTLSRQSATVPPTLNRDGSRVSVCNITRSPGAPKVTPGRTWTVPPPIWCHPTRGTLPHAAGSTRYEVFGQRLALILPRSQRQARIRQAGAQLGALAGEQRPREWFLMANAVAIVPGQQQTPAATFIVAQLGLDRERATHPKAVARIVGVSMQAIGAHGELRGEVSRNAAGFGGVGCAGCAASMALRTPRRPPLPELMLDLLKRVVEVFSDGRNSDFHDAPFASVSVYREPKETRCTFVRSVVVAAQDHGAHRLRQRNAPHIGQRDGRQHAQLRAGDHH